MAPRLIRIYRIQWWCWLFPFSDWKNLFWANLVQKIKIVGLGWNLVSRLIRICRIQWWCSLFCFRAETPFLGKFGQKNQNCRFKLKFGTKTNPNMQNSMVALAFSVLDRKHPFLLSLLPYWSREFEIANCRQHNFFILLRWVRPWIVSEHCLKIL